ncbi:hypothetical protein NIES4101_51910 [Calothrix sp. NIES-4101]|nr:hypothetical protein NIES4101_51910 [Calothrix sp. NIES-4101]
MNSDSGIKLQVIRQTVTLAIEDGREWGQRFLNDSSWRGDKKKMAKHAISESKFCSLRKGISSKLAAMAGISSEVAMSLYSQVKLASTLFTIYEIDTIRASAQPLVLAAAAGVSVTELAHQLEISPEINSGQENLQKALQSVPSQKILELNQTLEIQLITEVRNQDIHREATMSLCGNSVKAFIQAYRNP